MFSILFDNSTPVCGDCYIVARMFSNSSAADLLYVGKVEKELKI